MREDCRKAAVSELQGDAELAAAVLGQPEKGGGERERERARKKRCERRRRTVSLQHYADGEPFAVCVATAKC